MAHGFRLRDANGAEVFGPSERIFRIVATIVVTANGSTSIPFTAGNTSFVQCLGRYSNDYNPPVVAISGNTVSWSYPAYPGSSGTVRSEATIIIGEY
ncbi:MAG: hypothetical protein ACSLE1_15680 [Sphingobium sp.]